MEYLLTLSNFKIIEIAEEIAKKITTAKNYYI